MKAQKLILVGILLLVSAAALSAQNTLPDPHNDSCWSSVDALRACQLQAYERAQDYAQRCSSYPEYQCQDYYEPEQHKTSGERVAKGASQTTSATPTATANPEATTHTNLQTSETR
ncbi:MAG TPA: hypothetical protein VL240_05710 [Candidatus Binatia bacterium]|nr:hypothetical protein [Candidatus Binatia bacterium]